MGWFGSENQSNTDATNNSVTASGQAVVLNNRLTSGATGGDRVRIDVARGATYNPINNYGVGEEALQAGFASLASSLAGLGGVGESQDGPIQDALDARTADQIENAPEDAKKFGLANWILVAVGGVILLGAVLFKRKYK